MNLHDIPERRAFTPTLQQWQRDLSARLLNQNAAATWDVYARGVLAQGASVFYGDPWPAGDPSASRDETQRLLNEIREFNYRLQISGVRVGHRIAFRVTPEEYRMLQNSFHELTHVPVAEHAADGTMRVFGVHIAR